MTGNHMHVMHRGLSHAEAARRLAECGSNALPEAEPVRLWQRLLRQFMSPLIYILLFALALDLGLWGWEGALGVPFESLAIGRTQSANFSQGKIIAVMS